VNRLGAFSAIRAAVGGARIAFPNTVLPGIADRPLDTPARGVIRVLGARQVLQALLTGRSANAAVLWLGVEADLAHATSMIVLAALSRRYRRDALSDAAIALAFAVAGISAARVAPTDPAASSGLEGWRDRSAEKLARHLVPGYDALPVPAPYQGTASRRLSRSRSVRSERGSRNSWQ
jgi:hypothetical protein